MKQRTEEWFKSRYGRFTGSEVWKLFDTPEVRLNYIFDKSKEVIFDRPTPSKPNRAMQWGIDHEDEARFLFELESGLKVQDVGFIPFEEFGGGSPDGVIDEETIIEIKCPYTIRSHENLKTQGLPKYYYWQIQNNLMVTGAVKCYFITYQAKQNDMHYWIVEKNYQKELQLMQEIALAGHKRDMIVGLFEGVLDGQE